MTNYEIKQGLKACIYTDGTFSHTEHERNEFIQHAIGYINLLETQNMVLKNKRGETESEWIDIFGGFIFECKLCGVVKNDRTQFCPSCGKMMRNYVWDESNVRVHRK